MTMLFIFFRINIGKTAHIQKITGQVIPEYQRKLVLFSIPEQPDFYMMMK